MKEQKKSLLEKARQAVADRHAQPYHKRAILSGDWDSGSLVRDELARITEEERAPDVARK